MSFSADEIDRYARHLVLSEIGGSGQQRLKAARIGIVGLGGIGSPAALYLAAAGVGTVRLIDDDAVALSNLQRQILFTSADIDRSKVEAGADALSALNPHVSIETRASRLTAETAVALLSGCDVVIDGTDDVSARQATNAFCVRERVPLVSAALGRWTAQVAVFHGRPCYRCLVPDMSLDVEDCARLGVVGAVAGVAGAMAALEGIKLIVGAGAPLGGRLLIYDSLRATARVVRIAADPTCPVCADV